ncbi:alkaline phosphatase family protein [Nocardioides sp.]|uniref:alkaline phosphatase family protein n=1 Tax=Nocardioides sp. TaxID=35761 RepID=UPI00271AEA55|nr:alkaline phosphatase family protein [Nocardioides sp.]MDO9457267.1 alkaline phosphatase family protein [Nocardioides sp.]
MCGCGDRHAPGEPTPYDVGQAELTTGRRTLLKAGGGLAFSTAALAAGAGAADAAPLARTRKRVYVLVFDGCTPEEISGGQAPHLADLMFGGKRFAKAQSMPIMETIPNHVMMMTGVRPDRSGVPANSVFDRKLGAVRDLDRSSDLRADTIIERLNRRGLRTGTVLSKEYLYGVFGTRATARWEPFPVLPITGHAPDEFTINAAMAMVEDVDPHLMFVNLGDIDRFGHADVTGPLGVKALRRLALAKTDLYVQRFVDLLKSRGTWKHSMLVVLADHSMDWSTTNRVVSLAGPLDEDPVLRGRVQIADNGGADLLYWTGPSAQKEDAVRRMVRIARAETGVLSVFDRRHKSLRLGPQAGEVVAFCRSGWRFSDPDPVTSNPIPGNHGHPATRPIPFFINGGHPRLQHYAASSLVAQTIDVAPTVGRFFGLTGAPKGGYDGRARI